MTSHYYWAYQWSLLLALLEMLQRNNKQITIVHRGLILYIHTFAGVSSSKVPVPAPTKIGSLKVDAVSIFITVIHSHIALINIWSSAGQPALKLLGSCNYTSPRRCM